MAPRKQAAGVPRIGQLRTVPEVLEAYRLHRKEFTPNALGTLWSTIGKLVRNADELQLLSDPGRLVMLDELAVDTESALRIFNTRVLATTLGGMASMHECGAWRGEALWAKMAALSRQCVYAMSPQELSMTAHSFAKAGRRETALFDAIATAAVAWLHDFKPQDLASTAWAFAAADHPAPMLLDAIATAAAPRLRDFKPQGLANTAWAFATAGHAAPALLDAIAAVVAAARLRDFAPQDIANTAWAFAATGQPVPALFDAIATAAARRLRDFKPQNLASTAWAFAVADHPAPALFDNDAFVAQLCAAQPGFGPAGLAQLHQWQLWREERGAEGPSLPPELALLCSNAFSCDEGVPSMWADVLVQRDVVASLLAMQLALRYLEVRTPQGYSLDAVVLHGGREVAVVVDGPSHFRGRTPKGETAFKRRQLRAAGWALLPVPYWEWDALGSSKVAKQEYFRAALDLAISASPTPEASRLARAPLARAPLARAPLAQVPSAVSGELAASTTLHAAAPLSSSSVQSSRPGHTRSASSGSVQSQSSSASGQTQYAPSDWTKRMMHRLNEIE
jgi:hypothetical protein